MNQGQSNANGVITHAKSAGSTTATTKKRDAIPQPFQRADGKWSIRARRMGMNIYLSGFSAAHDARRAMASRLYEICQGRLPHGQGPDRTTVGKAMQQYALQYLPQLRGAAQEARRINTYLRAARLPSIELCRAGSKKAPPPGAAIGRHFAVWLTPHEKIQRDPSQELKDDSDGPLTGTTRLGSLRAALANQEMSNVTWYQVQDLVCALQADGLARATVLREVHLLRRLFNCTARVWREQAPASNPAVGVKVAGTPKRRGRIMSPQEQQRLEDTARLGRNEVVGPAFAFLAETGMRAGECINSVRWEDIEWDRGSLRLRIGHRGSHHVPLSSRAMDILRQLRLKAAPKGPVFPITFQSLKWHWKRVCERAGIEDLRIADLRRTAAVRSLDSSGHVLAMLAVTGFRSARFSRW